MLRTGTADAKVVQTGETHTVSAAKRSTTTTAWHVQMLELRDMAQAVDNKQVTGSMLGNACQPVKTNRHGSFT